MLPGNQHSGPMEIPEVSNIPAVSKDERLWATIAHLSAFAFYFSGIGHLLGPLIIWLAKRDGNPFVDDQAKEALNFQISVTLYACVAFVLVFVLIGIPLLFALSIFQIICIILAAIKANDGVAFRYPLNLRLIK